jgi:two-component system LytT family response regulator
MTCILIDDEINNLKNLEILINRTDSKLEIKGQFKKIDDALFFLKFTEIDIIFLDIQMPNGTGFDFLKQIEKEKYQIIFITAWEQYAIQALRNGALDYLVKPIIEDELKDAIRKAKKNIEAKNNNFETKRITLNLLNEKKVFLQSSICFIKGEDNYSIFHMSDGSKTIVSKTLKHFQEILSDRFIRIHKSYLMNLDYLKEVSSKNEFYVTLKNNIELPVSRRNFKQLLEKIAE